MANIMITDTCNLACPYCFANEFVNKQRNEIEREVFDEAVRFILGDGSHKSVGIIGGEPTLHSKFDELMRSLILNEEVQKIMLYTNGLLIDQHWNVCTHPKTHMLINCNPESIIGHSNYERLCRNLDVLFVEKMSFDRVTLGINMFRPEFEYAYILEMLKKYNIHKLRVSITVPDKSILKATSPFDYFLSMKQRVLKFFDELLQNEIVPHFDCNKIPYCLITKEEMDSFSRYLDNPKIRDRFNESNLSNNRVMCLPVIDIRQDLTAVRCFGLSDATKTSIRNFRCITDLEKYYFREIDSFAINIPHSKKCAGCYENKTVNCYGGCLAFKIQMINRIKRKKI